MQEPLGSRRWSGAGVVGLVLALSVGGACGQSGIDPLVQPRGVAIPGLTGMPSITTGADANTYLGMLPPKGPFDQTQPAGVIRTTEPVEYYVRLYTPGSSNASGPWIMRASTVRGLTPEQLRDRFALPFPVTYITNVLVPAGTCLMNGPAGPIMADFPPIPPATAGPWGHGGAQQTRLIAGDPSGGCRTAFVPGDDYINRRPIGANALWYAPVVGSGNAGSVGRYLDRLPAPAEYSDLYNAYNQLDVLNDGTATRLGPALTELAGENHPGVLWLALSNADRAARVLSDHARGAFGNAPEPPSFASAATAYAAAAPAPRGGSVAASGRWWAAGGGVFGRVGGSDERSGYRFDGGQGMAGYDWSAPDRLAGAAFAVESSNLTVQGPGNGNTVTSLRLGTYGAADFNGLTLAGAALLSWDDYATSRELATFGRSAAASYDGWSGAFSIEASRAFAAGTLRIEPMAGLSAVALSRPGFTEAGAGGLSLAVERESATKLASRLGATVSAPIRLDDKMLRPWLRAFWAHDLLDTAGGMTAAFVGATAPGSFTVQSASPGRDAALVGAGIKLEHTPTAALLIAYDGEWSRNGAIHAIKAGATLTW